MNFGYDANAFKEATPINTRVKMAISGMQGSGKTVSALRLAKGMGGETAVIDSENRRALKYSADFKFKHLDLPPPFSALNYMAAIEAATKAGFENIIVDSMSHEHEGIGGALDQVEDYLTEKAGSDFKKREALKMSAWIKPKSERNRLIQFGIQRVDANIFLAFRGKNKTTMEKVKQENGYMKTEISKSFEPVGGADFYFEMDIMAMLAIGKQGVPDWESDSSRINDFGGELKNYLLAIQQFDEETGRRMKEFNIPKKSGFPMLTGKGTTHYETARQWADEAVRIITAMTSKKQFDAFSNYNGASLQNIKLVDEAAYETVLTTLSARQSEVETNG